MINEKSSTPSAPSTKLYKNDSHQHCKEPFVFIRLFRLRDGFEVCARISYLQGLLLQDVLPSSDLSRPGKLPGKELGDSEEVPKHQSG